MRPGARPGAPEPVGPARALLSSLVLHGLIGFAIVFAAVFTWHTKSVPVHSVEAYVVHGAAGAGVARPVPAPAPAPAPAPEPVPVPVPAAQPPEPPVATPAPVPDPALARAAADAEALKRTQLAQAKEARAAAARAEAERAHAAQAEAARRAETQAKAQQQAAAAAHAAEVARLEKAAHDKAELAARSRRESDLARQLADEEHADAHTAAQAGVLARYAADITARIQRAWIRPPTARVGLRCTVYVTQVPGGTVTGVRLGTCNGDAAVRQSIEAAVYRAAPLPPPSDPSLFERNLTLEFAPDA